MLLSELKTNKSGIIVKVRGHGVFRKRISEMGFIKGQKITVIKNAPLADPVQYSIMGYEVSLRKAEASLIEVISEGNVVNKPKYYGTQELDYNNQVNGIAEKTINIALIGNPNSGKTSIFNSATRSSEHVGNYGGVTVDTKLARIEYQGYIFNIFDLPGTYSLNSYSPEESFVRNFLSDQMPDIIVNVLDSTNLDRNLFLTTQLIDLNLRMIIALNFYDEFKKSEAKFDYQAFSQLVGIPVVPTIGAKGKGLAVLFDTIIAKFRQDETERKKIHINYGKDVENSLEKIRQEIHQNENFHITARLCARYLSIKMLEGDKEIASIIDQSFNPKAINSIADHERNDLEAKYGESTESLITDARFGFIFGALKETFTPKKSLFKSHSEKIDNLLTSKFLGLPLFFGFLWIMFIATFKIGRIPTDWITSGIGWLSLKAELIIPQGDLQSLVSHGIIEGVGGIVVFLPNIMILFLFISFLEDSGYMSRAAFIMDKLMHKIGLHGKSFIPLIMGFGCNVPALLSTRIIESRNNRLLTMLILPFMSCSARLPVYILMIGTFFPRYQGTVLFGVYLTGIVLAIVSALLFKRIFFRKEDSPFVMELPPYRMPTFRNVSRHMWEKSFEYIKKIGGIILISTIIIWGLNYYPQNSVLTSNTKSSVQAISTDVPVLESQYSYLEQIGRFVQPIMGPLGFDWKMTVSILAGIPGKEIVVSTLAVLYEDEDSKTSLEERIKNDEYTSGNKAGQKVYNPAVALAFLMFILIYFPCVAVIATIAQESASLFWPVFLILYTSILAWSFSFLVYRLGILLIN
ncbi:MAG: ferrous iron transport protein B [Bacteroidales bacterium]|nr:ferrous iron transport protein B [Bacteroidales bacterium]